jgi:hypothetical protein
MSFSCLLIYFIKIISSNECFCGNTFGRYGASENCYMRCAYNKNSYNGSSQYICGGPWALSVYMQAKNEEEYSNYENIIGKLCVIFLFNLFLKFSK